MNIQEFVVDKVHELSAERIAAVSGISAKTIRHFMKEGNCQVYSLECILDALGYELAVKKGDKDV